MRKGEFEIFGEELLDVWALDVVGLLELNNFEDLFEIRIIQDEINPQTYMN